MLSILPGRPQSTRQALCTVNWDGLRLVAYISGNNAIVFNGRREILAYLSIDEVENLYALSIEEESGNIAVCDETNVFIYTPSGRDYGDLRWTRTFELACSAEGPLKSLSWGSSDELLVGGKTLSLWSLANYNNPQVIWTSTLSSPVAFAHFSPDAGLIASCGEHDRMVKIWRRLSYEQDSTRFDISYLPHPSAVIDVYWRRVWHHEQTLDNLLFTCCTDKQVRVWSHSDHHASSLLRMVSAIDTSESIQPRRLSMGSVSKNRFTFILHSRDLSRAAERALQTSRQGTDHALEHLIEIANRSPEICVVLDGLGHMSAWGLENAGYKSKPLPEKFNVALVDGVNVALPSGSSIEDLVQIQAFANNDVSASLCILVHSYSGQIDWYSGSFTEFFDTASKNDRVRLQSSWSGHASAIDKVVASPDHTHFMSWTDTNRAIVWCQSSTGALIRKSRLKIESKIVDGVVLNNHGVALVLTEDALEVWDIRVLAGKMIEQVEMDFEDAHALVVLDQGAFPSTEVVVGIFGVDFSILTYRIRMPASITSTANHYRNRITRLETMRFPRGQEADKDSRHAFTMYPRLEDTTGTLLLSQTGALRLYHNNASKPANNPTLISMAETYIQPSKILAACRSFTAFVHDNLRTLSIWNIKAQCYEFVHTFSERDEIYGLHWYEVFDGLSLLAVRSAYTVFVLSQRRYSDNADQPTWDLHAVIRVRNHSSNMIGSLCWITKCRISVSAGDQILVFDVNTDGLKRVTNGPGSDASQILTTIQNIVANNCALPIFHPAIVSSMLQAGQLPAARAIFEALRNELRYTIDGDMIPSNLDLNYIKFVGSLKDHSFTHDSTKSSSEGEFDMGTVTQIQEAARKISRHQLSKSCTRKLQNLIDIYAQMQEHQTSMDKWSLTYLYHFLLSTLELDAEDGELTPLPYSAIVAASLSNSQEALVHFVLAYLDQCNLKLTWSTARSLGLFLFLKPSSPDDQSIRIHFETVARNEYNKDTDDRNPVNCSLHYLALNKKAVLQSLWRTTVGVKEKENTMKLLAHDFTQHKWKATAFKNAYALLSRRRFEYAAAFFLLGGGLSDACNVCVNQLHDIQLAIAIARVWTGSEASREHVLHNLIERSMLNLAIDSPQARWMAIWQAIRTDNYKRAVQVIVQPIDQLFRDQLVTRQENGSDDERENEPFEAFSWQANRPDGLVELYLHFRSVIREAGEWTVKVMTPKQEWDFVMRCVNWYMRSGMELLALALVKNWQFVEWQTPKATAQTNVAVTDSTIFSTQQGVASMLNSWTDDTPSVNKPRRESAEPAKDKNRDTKNKPPPTQFVEPSADSLLDSFGF